MFVRLISIAKLSIVVFSLTSMLAPGLRAQSLALPANDIIPPSMSHEVIDTEVAAGESQTLTATVTDNIAVESVSLFYRSIGQTEFKQLNMVKLESSDTYAVEIDASLLTEPGIEYYLRAEDTAGNSLLRGFTFEPLVLSVGPATLSGSSSDAGESGKTGLSSKKYLWIGLGVLAVGALAAGGGGGGGGGSDSDGALTVTTTSPVD